MSLDYWKLSARWQQRRRDIHRELEQRRMTGVQSELFEELVDTKLQLEMLQDRMTDVAERNTHSHMRLQNQIDNLLTRMLPLLEMIEKVKGEEGGPDNS